LGPEAVTEYREVGFDRPDAAILLGRRPTV
jgi:hypothetical protein